jgi:transposase
VPRCTCPDYAERGQPCKHVFAVEYALKRESAPDGTVTTTETVTVTDAHAVVKRTCAERKTYKQDWPSYNAAQTNEKRKVQELLCELCKGIADPPRRNAENGGRPPVPLRDAIFACAFKVYSTVSGRRFACDLDDARAKGYVSRPISYNAVSKYMEMPGLAPILHALIAESAGPLKSVETDFAVDSSGFATSRFVRWFDHKYGVVKQEYDWVKVHLATGVKTNIVTAVEIDERYAADCPRFKGLLDATAKRGFSIREVSADSAYMSYDNADAVAALGGTPYIAFKAGTTAAQGGTLAKMFHYYNFNREDFLAHYHKRSNVETTFSMVKAKFGDALRSKTDAAMVNESLCKVLCHNLCVLIQSAYELGVNAKFWGAEAAAPEVIAEVDDFLAAMAWV